MSDLESRLRATMAERARHAPPGGPLAERIIDEVQAPAPVLRPRHGWRTWSLPLLAAGAVAAVVGAVVGIEHTGSTASPPQHTVVPPATQLPTVATTPSVAPSSPAPTTSGVHANGNAVHNFSALDVSFVSATDGWALGSADCLHGSGRCSAFFHTTDGTNWTSMPGTQFNVPGVNGCKAPCVEHIRFATPEIGYAFGPSAVLMTTDGGLDWTRQPLPGADALETLDGNVISVLANNVPKASFERAAIGTNAWHPFTLIPSTVAVTRVELARAGHAAVLEFIEYNPAKGIGDTGVLYRSSDDGVTWTKVGEPCEYVGVGYQDESTAATMAADGSVVVSCAVLSAGDLEGFGHTVTSTDGGAHFIPPGTGGKLRPAQLLAAASRSVQLVVAGNGVYRSVDAGESWTPVKTLAGHRVSFLGFESPTVGRAICDNGRTIWTTRDGGATWSSSRFG